MERSSHARGVYYSAADYLGVARRVAIDVVDVLVPESTAIVRVARD